MNYKEAEKQYQAHSNWRAHVENYVKIKKQKNNNYSPETDKYYSEIINIETHNSKKISMPVYSVAKDGSFALTLNFDRLTLLRPDYGYFYKKNIELKNYDLDGIWKIDSNSVSGGNLKGPVLPEF